MSQPSKPVDNQLQDIIDFYIKNYRHVEVTRCCNCEAVMCLWILEDSSVQANFSIHHQGLRRIEVGDNMLSTRKRHDGIMGYQCKCGNNSLLSAVEKGIVSTSNNPRAVLSEQPHTKMLVEKKMIAEGYRPDVASLGGGKYVVDGFETEVLKNG